MKNEMIYMKDDYGVLYRINGYKNEIYNTENDDWEPWEDDEIFFYRNNIEYLNEEEAKEYIEELKERYL